MSQWTAAHVAAIAGQPVPAAPIIVPQQATPVLSKHDLWDLWPLQNADGSITEIAGGLE